MKRLACAVLGLLLSAGASGCLTVADDEGPILSIELYWDEDPEGRPFEGGTCRGAGVDEMDWWLIRKLNEPPAECADDRDGDGTPNAMDDADNDPCVPDEDAEACGSGDADNDDVLNARDPDNDPPCDDEEIVASDTQECANAIDVIEPARGEYKLVVSGRNKDADPLWDVECVGLKVLRFDVAYECDIEGL